jgi:hypothetical protein
MTVNKTQCLVIDNGEPNSTEDSSIRLLYAVHYSDVDTRKTHNKVKDKHNKNEEEIAHKHEQ